MNHHPVVLQQRIQPAPVGRNDADLLEWICAEYQKNEEEEQRTEQRGVDVGHQRPLRAAIGQGCSRAEKAKQKGPKQQAARLPAPDGCKLVESRQAPLRTVPDVADLKLVVQETVPQNDRSNADKRCHCVDRMKAAVGEARGEAARVAVDGVRLGCPCAAPSRRGALPEHAAAVSDNRPISRKQQGKHEHKVAEIKDHLALELETPQAQGVDNHAYTGKCHRRGR